MKKTLSNVMPNSSERQLLLEVEMMEFSKGRYFYKSHLRLKRIFFWTFLKGIPFYNVPFMVRNYGVKGTPDYVYGGTYSARVFPTVTLYKDIINFQSDTHPALRYNKTNDSDKFHSKDLAKMSFHEFSREIMNRQNGSWNLLAAGYCLDVFFAIANERLAAEENNQDHKNTNELDPLDEFFKGNRKKL
jgi:hypothetical protein